MLLDTENKGLKASFVNEKKRRKRGKPLLLETPAKEDGGAKFFSPNKIDQAFERRDQKVANEEAERIQKQVDKVRREAEKAKKARLIEERKAERANAKALKNLHIFEMRRQKDEAKVARIAKRQRQKELQMKAKQAPKQFKKLIEQGSDKKQKVVVMVVEDEDSPLSVNARCREIRLPQRFRPIKW